MSRSRSTRCLHSGCGRAAVQDGVCADHAKADRSEESLSDDPLRLLYFGLIDGQPIADADRAELLTRARECWYEACFAVQSPVLSAVVVDLAAATMESSLELASQIWRQERAIQRSVCVEPTLKRKINRASARLETAMNNLLRGLTHLVQ